MSDNYRFYRLKVAESRLRQRSGVPLSRQLHELFDTVRWCERIWAIEDRIDRESGRR
ncbi:MAG TPA: hypothetical protein VJR46_05015 [Candidatus Dormibacteraeota bacterium]|nr:hypothetical protein [Candidatus Dormibacteraeota bacterium]